jgi:hypothetical protein
VVKLNILLISYSVWLSLFTAKKAEKYQAIRLTGINLWCFHFETFKFLTGKRSNYCSFSSTPRQHRFSRHPRTNETRHQGGREQSYPRNAPRVMADYKAAGGMGWSAAIGTF